MSRMDFYFVTPYIENVITTVAHGSLESWKLWFILMSILEENSSEALKIKKF